MKAIYERLVSINHALQGLKGKPHTYRDLTPLQAELDAIDAGRTQGIFAGSPQTHIPAGQAVAAELLAENYDLVDELLRTASDMLPEMRAVTGQLMGIKGALQRIAVAKSHTMQDIQHYQQMLDGIDRRRQEGGGVFCGSLKEGRVPEGQAVASDLLASCYSLVEALKDTAGDLGASLTPIYRQMSGIHHGLEDLRRKPGGYTTTDIARLQGQLDAIDSARKDGIFGGDLQHVPPGQAACSSLMAKCYRLVEVLYEGAKDTDMAPLGAAPTLQMPQAPRADPSGQLPLPVESTGV